MPDVKTITHDNVLKLRDAMIAERTRVDELTLRVQHLETLTKTLLIKMEEVNERSLQSFAISKQGGL